MLYTINQNTIINSTLYFDLYDIPLKVRLEKINLSYLSLLIIRENGHFIP